MFSNIPVSDLIKRSETKLCVVLYSEWSTDFDSVESTTIGLPNMYWKKLWISYILVFVHKLTTT